MSKKYAGDRGNKAYDRNIANANAQRQIEEGKQEVERGETATTDKQEVTSRAT